MCSGFYNYYKVVMSHNTIRNLPIHPRNHYPKRHCPFLKLMRYNLLRLATNFHSFLFSRIAQRSCYFSRTNGSGTGTVTASVEVAAAASAPTALRESSAQRPSRTRPCRRLFLRPHTRTRSTGSVRQARRALPAPGHRRARSQSPPRAARWREARRPRPSLRQRPVAHATSHLARASTSAGVLRVPAATTRGPSSDTPDPMDQFCTLVNI